MENFVCAYCHREFKNKKSFRMHHVRGDFCCLEHLDKYIQDGALEDDSEYDYEEDEFDYYDEEDEDIFDEDED